MTKGLGTCLKTTFGMAVNYYFVFFMEAVVVGMFSYNTTKDILVLPFLLVSLFTLLRLWKNLLWDTAYGESAVLYTSLPASSAVWIFSKIFTAGFSLGLLMTFLFPAFLVPAMMMGNDLFRDAQWINAMNTRLLNWEQMYGLTPEGIGRVLLAIWPASFLLAGAAGVVISLIGRWRGKRYE